MWMRASGRRCQRESFPISIVRLRTSDVDLPPHGLTELGQRVQYTLHTQFHGPALPFSDALPALNPIRAVLSTTFQTRPPLGLVVMK